MPALYEKIRDAYSKKGVGYNRAQATAAAPELLEALKTVLQLAEAGVIQRNETGKPQWNLTDELQTIAHAAILKAEG